MKIQNEVQSMHWHNFQVNILVHINYQHNPLIDHVTQDSIIIKEVHYYVSNDPSHDYLFVQHTFMFC
jgi:hypothetical protein